MSLGLSDILAATNGRLANSESFEEGSESVAVHSPGPLAQATPDQVAYFFSKEFQSDLPATRAGVIITAEPFVEPLSASGLPLWTKSAVVACPDPYLAMGVISERLAQTKKTAGYFEEKRGTVEIHPTAIVDPSAEISEGCSVGPYCVVAEGVILGKGVRLHSHNSIGANVRIGDDSVLFSNVVVYESCQIGSRVRIHAGAKIGGDGFGYAPVINERIVSRHQKIYHFGSVLIGDDVEIGLNSTIDRGTFGDTVIENLVKIDNLVQIGHNCRLEKGAVVCGSTGVAGSAHIGRFAYVGGQAGVSNKVHIGDYAKVAAMTLVSKDVPSGQTIAGNPQRESKKHFKIQAILNKMLKK